MRKGLIPVLLMLAACGGGGSDGDAPGEVTRGVSADTITIGTHTDLSGPIAVWGVPLTNGLRMRFEEANAAGGVHGRRIRLVAEDTQYQVPLAVKATNKLLNVDEIFLMVGSMGTPHNNAVFDKMFEASVPSLFPATAAVSMYEPLHALKFSYFISYRDQARGGIQYMHEKHGVNKVCLQALATDYGAEVEIGYNQAVEENGLESVYVGHHKGSETDFTATITSIKNSGCEMLFLGPFIKDAVLIYSAARDAGWDAPIVANMVPYTYGVAKSADDATEGLYVVAPFVLLDVEDAEASGGWIGDWLARYRELYGEDPAPQAQMGYVMAEFVVRALEGAGPDVTVEKTLAALEAISDFEDPFGGPSMSFSPTKHQGSDHLVLSQVQDGKWVVVEPELDY